MLRKRVCVSKARKRWMRIVNRCFIKKADFYGRAFPPQNKLPCNVLTNDAMHFLASIQRLAASVGFLFLLLLSLPAAAQVKGCRDPLATNYNAAATITDTTCTYATTLYTPPAKATASDNVLTEASGLQWAGNALWTFADGGGAAAIYRVDTQSYAVLQTVQLGGATNVDWEDIAFDGTYFYLGDFGNNANGARTNLKIYKFPLSAIPDYGSQPMVTIPPAQVSILNFTYSNQVPVVPTDANKTAFDCEAMLVDGGKIHLFTKNWIDATTTHFVINGTDAGTYVADSLETLAAGYLVTAADKAPGTNLVVLMGYQYAFPANHFMHLLSDYSNGLYFNGNRRKINLPSALEMGQAEGITLTTAVSGFINNEKIFTVGSKLHTFNISPFVPRAVLPLDLKSFFVTQKDGESHISWQFASTVNRLELQYSSNRTDFVMLQSYATSATGSYRHRPATAVACYRLAWTTTAGAERFSDVVCLNVPGRRYSGFYLNGNGELQFTAATASPRQVACRLLSTDGRLVAQTPFQTVAAGTNKFKLTKTLAPNSVYVVQLMDGAESVSFLVKAP